MQLANNSLETCISTHIKISIPFVSLFHMIFVGSGVTTFMTIKNEFIKRDRVIVHFYYKGKYDVIKVIK